MTRYSCLAVAVVFVALLACGLYGVGVRAYQANCASHVAALADDGGGSGGMAAPKTIDLPPPPPPEAAVENAGADAAPLADNIAPPTRKVPTGHKASRPVSRKPKPRPAPPEPVTISGPPLDTLPEPPPEAQAAPATQEQTAAHLQRTSDKLDRLTDWLATPEGQRRVKHLQAAAQH